MGLLCYRWTELYALLGYSPCGSRSNLNTQTRVRYQSTHLTFCKILFLFEKHIIKYIQYSQILQEKLQISHNYFGCM